MSDFRVYLDKVNDLVWSYFLMGVKTVKSSQIALFPEESLLQLDLELLQKQWRSSAGILLWHTLTEQQNGYANTPTLHVTKAIIILNVPIPKP